MQAYIFTALQLTPVSPSSQLSYYPLPPILQIVSELPGQRKGQHQYQLMD